MWFMLLAFLGCQRPVVQPVVEAAQLDPQPERASGCRDGLQGVRGSGAVVVAAHPEATRIGAEILAKGGSAADAAVAVAVALTLVEPQSSGLGGGAFALTLDAASAQLDAYDGREVAPAKATAELFLTEQGPLPWPRAVPGGLSVGVPGLVRMLELLHESHGRLPWAELLEPTIALAEAGFGVTPRMSQSITAVEAFTDVLRSDPGAKAYFYPGGVALKPGDHLVNPALATTLRALAVGGPDAFYEGPLAERIVAAVQGADRPGRLTTQDLEGYRAVRRDAVCIDTRGRRVCGHPPPTSGGITTLQIIGMLGHLKNSGGPSDPATAHQFVEAVRLAWADRDAVIADPDAVDVPVDAMLHDAYLSQRASMIGDKRLLEVSAGVTVDATPRHNLCAESQHTSHLVVVDAEGNAVSMTSSIEAAFGSGVFVAGFLLNNQLTDFSFKPTDAQGKPIANAAAACKRPRSSMSPLMVLDDAGELELAIGSPGGSRIIQYTARVVVDVLDHGLDLQQAISRPNLTWRNQHLELENDCGEPAPPAALVAGLEQRGHTLKQTSLTSGLHGVQRTADGWLGGVDPRREGEVRFVPSPATEDGLADRVSLKAVVEIDPKPGGKRFQGVWLVREGLPKLLVDYRRRSLWLAFEGKAVEVQGEPYEPEGQAIQAPHFRVHGLTLSDAEAATSWIGFGPEQELEGRFELREGEPGSKSEGVSTLVFVTSESSWEVLNPEPAMEGTASVKARSVDRSATAAHATGPALWVRSVD